MLRLEKTNPMPRNRDRRYITDYECAIWFTMPKAKWVFNRQDESYQRPKFVHSVEKGLHPTQKNLKLMEELVKIHSNVGMTVVDPFSGSFTTGVACANLGRVFIGIEVGDDYFDTGVQRMKGVYNGDIKTS
jgi:DNA modification methylase